jgi:hypothetical protein
MKLYRKDDLWIGCIAITNTGKRVEVTDDDPDHEYVKVKDEGGSEERRILVGEAFNPAEIPEWLEEVAYPQPECKCETCEAGRSCENEDERYAFNALVSVGL